METKTQFDRLDNPASVKVGDKVVWCTAWSPNDDYAHFYNATVTKATPKTVIIETQRRNRWGMGTATMEFRSKVQYNGTHRLEPWGDKSSGCICLFTPELEARMAEDEAKRAQEAAEEQARKDEQERQRQERIAREHAECHAANPGIEPKLVGAVGDLRCYGFNMITQRGEAQFVVVNVTRGTDTYSRDDKLIWKGMANYVGGNTQYGPRSFGSTSEFQADTLEQLFHMAVEKVW